MPGRWVHRHPGGRSPRCPRDGPHREDGVHGGWGWPGVGLRPLGAVQRSDCGMAEPALAPGFERLARRLTVIHYGAPLTMRSGSPSTPRWLYLHTVGRGTAPGSVEALCAIRLRHQLRSLPAIRRAVTLPLPLSRHEDILPARPAVPPSRSPSGGTHTCVGVDRDLGFDIRELHRRHAEATAQGPITYPFGSTGTPPTAAGSLPAFSASVRWSAPDLRWIVIVVSVTSAVVSRALTSPEEGLAPERRRERRRAVSGSSRARGGSGH